MSPHGILPVDKPPDTTSFQVVAMVRRSSGVKKVGHAGTLDPTATGVLLVCLGQAVRVSEYLMELPKTYRATVSLGTSTDTYDATGETVFEGDADSVDQRSLTAALESLSRQEQQVPPKYSAVKVGGTPAHRLVRAGRTVTLRPRAARIDRINLLAFRSHLVEIEVHCGKGTYIRTLADDLGRLLGCGAHLQELRRTAVGPFEVEEALSRQRLESAFADGTWQDLLLPLDFGLGRMPAVHLDLQSEGDVRHGCSLDAASPPFQRLTDLQDGLQCRAYGEDGALIGILHYEGGSGRWRPRKVFANTGL